MASNSFIRNFSIIAHINHGKSTLADRFLEITKTISPDKMKPQFLDQMGLERERGITIKMQPVRMRYVLDDKEYELNLIDTPGHVDFSYEVSRALAAVEGAVLLVDAQKGVQAQTLSHLRTAQELKLTIIPVINKIDLPQARTEAVRQEIASLLQIEPEEIIAISAKTNEGVIELLKTVIKKIPPPKEIRQEMQALVFDSMFDAFKGVIAYVRIFGGNLSQGDKIFFMKSGFSAEVLEVGIFAPELRSLKKMNSGEIGYVATGLKEIGAVKVGDTMVLKADKERFGSSLEPLAGYKEPQAVVFASFYPVQAADLDLLRMALGKLKLNDAALLFEPEASTILGRGFKVGFLGLLHLEIVGERLRREFGLQLTTSTPSVAYEVVLANGETITIQNAALLPETHGAIKEPWAILEIVAPVEYVNSVTQILMKHRGFIAETQSLGTDYLLIKAEAPLSEIITGFYDNLKSATSGFASLNWRVGEFREGKLSKLEIWVAGEKVDGLSRLVHRDSAYEEGRRVVQKLKVLLPPQQFTMSLQASADGRMIAREDLSAIRKDVTGHLYGGDRSRKDKLLKKQKEGKKKLKETGRIRIPSKVFLEILKP